jgi:hypothetical protein
MLLVDALASIKNWKGTSPHNFPTSFLGANVGSGVFYESILQKLIASVATQLLARFPYFMDLLSLFPNCLLVVLSISCGYVHSKFKKISLTIAFSWVTHITKEVCFG